MYHAIRRVIWIVLDGVGAGALPDAAAYGDAGTDTLAHTARVVGGLCLPHLESTGLGNLACIEGLAPRQDTAGAYGKLIELSPGKDSSSGHWELAGVVLREPFPAFPEGFPHDLVRRFEKRIGRKVMGNKAASGTEIIAELGEEHMRTGRPILYTSADSVFQLAAHKDAIPLQDLYAMCHEARELLQGEYAVNRVIARPFVGKPGAFMRIGGERLDLSLSPPHPTVLVLCREAGITVKGLGKVGDLYAGMGLSESIHTAGNEETMERLLAETTRAGEGVLMANLVDFDTLYGHRRDPQGFAHALREFDGFLPGLQGAMGPDDVCIIVSDHGCDPTHAGSDHTREYGILLVFGAKVARGRGLGIRRSFADCGKSVAELMGVDSADLDGKSFAREILL
jgi:phosphopentomutase